MRVGGRNPPLEPDAALIRTLALLLSETGLSEIEYAVGDRRIRVARGPAGATASPPPSIAATIASEARAAPIPAEHPGAVKAPMVGIAYLAANPGGEPFVRLGAAVAEGDTLLIIEAMKVMNQIRAPRAGTVARILVADSDPVEYGAVLMLIE